MRPSHLLALAATVCALASAPAVAHPPRVAGTPLLELYGRGLQRTLQAIPNCGLTPPCDFRNPRFASWHVVLFTDGRASVSIVENALQDAAGASGEAVLGLGDPALLAQVRQALAESRIGFAFGDCSVAAFFPTPGTNDKVEVLDLDWQLSWYGRGNRVAVVELPDDASHTCDLALDRLVRSAVEYAHSVRQAASP